MARSRRRKNDLPEDVGEQLLLSFGLLEGLLPMAGSELEQPIGRPAADQAEQVAEVAERLNVVQAGAREERDEDGVDLGAIVTTDEEPVFPIMERSP